MNQLNLRSGNSADIPACAQICYDAFKAIADVHHFPPDFPSTDVASGLFAFLFSNKDVYSVVAEKDGEVVGSNFLWKDTCITGVGPVTVKPGVQNSQIGRTLMEDVIRHAKENGYSGIRLVQAAYHNRSFSLYSKLGFAVKEQLTVVQGEPLRLGFEGFHVRSATLADLAACNQLYVDAHGHPRTGELVGAIHQGIAKVVERGERITAFTTSVGYFGFTVAESNDDLIALIAHAEFFPGTGFLVPSRNHELLKWCFANGLRSVQPMTLMASGLYNEPMLPFLPSVLY